MLVVIVALCLSASTGIPDPGGGGVGNEGGRARFTNGTHLSLEQANLIKKFAKV